LFPTLNPPATNRAFFTKGKEVEVFLPLPVIML
jgi:hypothetical protein